MISLSAPHDSSLPRGGSRPALSKLSGSEGVEWAFQSSETLSSTGWSRPSRPAERLLKKSALAAEVLDLDWIEMKDVLSCGDNPAGFWPGTALQDSARCNS